jgi:predicted DCC family thiol-disulfide oxidoreductase YuxK
MSLPENNPIVLFDGVCNFCNRWVNFIIRHDTKKKFRFAALQSDIGKKLLKQYDIPEKTESVVLIYNQQAHIKSTAGLHILYHIGGLYALPFALVIFPAYIRDFYYDVIARNRYKWWGKMDQCMIPTQDVKERFL